MQRSYNYNSEIIYCLKISINKYKKKKKKMHLIF